MSAATEALMAGPVVPAAVAAAPVAAVTTAAAATAAPAAAEAVAPAAVAAAVIVVTVVAVVVAAVAAAVEALTVTSLPSLCDFVLLFSALSALLLPFATDLAIANVLLADRFFARLVLGDFFSDCSSFLSSSEELMARLVFFR